MASSTTENYLKTIYALGERHPDDSLVRLGELANELEVTPGTITTMIRALAERGLVDYTARKGVRLTEAGRVQALQVLRRHRLIESFLVQVMHMDWSEVHEDAEALEHAVSDKLVERMAEMMGHPERDPHGDPIPTLDAQLPNRRALTLGDAPPGHYRIVQVRDQDTAFLEWMGQSGLRPGSQFQVLHSDPRAGAVTLRVDLETESVSIGLDIARQIRVEQQDNPALE